MEVKSIKIGTVLSGRELFSPYYGGACARWVYETYTRLPSQIQPTVFSIHTPNKIRYALNFITVKDPWFWPFLLKIPILRRYQDYFWLKSAISQLINCDVIHLMNRPHWASLLRKLNYKGKIIGHLQNDHLGSWSAHKLDNLSKNINSILSCSAFIANQFCDKSQSIAPLSSVIFNGVNRRLFKPDFKRRIQNRIFFVGRFDQQKGVLPLIQSFALVLKKHPTAELVIGGTTGFGTHTETPYVNKVKHIAAQINNEYGHKIKFAGYIDHDKDLPIYLQQASIAVFPSVFEEPFGMVFAEAMACGTPVIGTKRGGIPQVIGNAGIIIEKPEPELIAKAICDLLMDPARLQKLSKLALSRSEIFDWDNIAKQFYENILSVLKK